MQCEGVKEGLDGAADAVNVLTWCEVLILIGSGRPGQPGLSGSGGALTDHD